MKKIPAILFFSLSPNLASLLLLGNEFFKINRRFFCFLDSRKFRFQAVLAGFETAPFIFSRTHSIQCTLSFWFIFATFLSFLFTWLMILVRFWHSQASERDVFFLVYCLGSLKLVFWVFGILTNAIGWLEIVPLPTLDMRRCHDLNQEKKLVCLTLLHESVSKATQCCSRGVKGRDVRNSLKHFSARSQFKYLHNIFRCILFFFIPKS